MKKQYDVVGMSCAACVARVEKAVLKNDGVESVSANLLNNSMYVVFNENKTSSDDIIKSVERAGYTAFLKSEKKEVKKESSKRSSSMKSRLICSVVFLVMLMTISMSKMLFSYPLPSFLEGEENALSLALLQFILCLPILYANRSYFEKGYAALFRLSPNMDSLIAIGTSASVIYSIVTMFKMSACLALSDINALASLKHGLFFEGAAMIVTLVSVGKALEEKSKQKTGEALEKLTKLIPKKASVEKDSKIIKIDINELKVDDIIVIKAGETIPADAVVIEGAGEVDESALTGESLPVSKETESRLIGATLLKSGFIKARVVSVGENTVFAKIIGLVENAMSQKAPIARIADKIAGVFVPTVIGISAVTFIVWSIVSSNVATSLSYAISVLVISCPCALGLATPVAVTMGMGKGAENGILFKRAEILEALHKADTMVFDKTGTLTKGCPVVTDIIPFESDEKKLLALAASIEEKSEHPLSLAILNMAQEKRVEIKEALEYTAFSGKGIKAVIDKKVCLGGNARLLDEHGIDTSSAADIVQKLSGEGKTPLYFSQDGVLCGIIAVADTLKENAGFVISELKRLSKKVVMLTGDNQRTALGIGKDIAFDEIISDVLPEDKEKIIKEFQEKGHTVIMVGDGINDAPALARANVGIAMGSGTDVARDCADVVLMNSSLTGIYDAVRLSRQTITNIKQNLFWAFFYNALGIPLAAGAFVGITGWSLTPALAAAAMSMSSLFVVTNALRLKKFKMTKTPEKTKAPIKEDKEMKILIEGMMCSHCTSHVEKALSALQGVEKLEVSLENACASVQGSVSKEACRKAIEDAGYKVLEIKD